MAQVAKAEAMGTGGPSRPMRKRMRSAALWSLSLFPFRKGLAFGTNIVLARLLLPEAFGLVALASSVALALSMFSEVGSRAALIQNKREDDEFINTAWTIQAMRGLFIGLGVALASWPMAIFYNSPQLRWILVGIASAPIIEGFYSTKLILLSREMNERPRALLGLGRAVTRSATMIVWAWIWPSPWALVAGSLSGNLFTLATSHMVLSGIQNHFCWDPKAARSLYLFGKWIFIGTVIAYFGQQLDRLMLGKLAAIGVLGVYSISFMVVNASLEGLSILNNRVVFPAMCEVARNDKRQFLKRLLQIRSIVLPVAVLTTLSLVFISPWFFKLLYDEHYAAAVWMAPLGATIAWSKMLNGSVNNSLLALGKARPLALSGLFKVIVISVAAPLGLYIGGLPMFILGIGLGWLAEHIMDLTVLAIARINLFKQDGLYTLLLVLLAGAGVFSQHWNFARGISTDPTASSFGIVLPAAILLGVAGWVLWRSSPVLFR